MNEWMHEWMNEWMDEWMNGWMNGWMDESINQSINQWINKWMIECLNHCMQECVKAWMNGLMNLVIISSTIRGIGSCLPWAWTKWPFKDFGTAESDFLRTHWHAKSCLPIMLPGTHPESVCFGWGIWRVQMTSYWFPTGALSILFWRPNILDGLN